MKSPIEQAREALSALPVDPRGMAGVDDIWHWYCEHDNIIRHALQALTAQPQVDVEALRSAVRDLARESLCLFNVMQIENQITITDTTPVMDKHAATINACQDGQDV